MKTVKLIWLYPLLILIMIILTQGCTRKVEPEIQLPEGKTAKIVFVVGTVYINTLGTGWQKAHVGEILNEGTTIKTEKDSFCEIVISSGTIFRMKDDTILQLTMLSQDQEHNTTILKILTGDLFSKVKKIAYRGSYKIETSTVTLGVRGTDFFVHTEHLPQKQSTKVIVDKGVVRVWIKTNIPSQGKIPRPLAPVIRKIRRGVKVRGGYKLEVDSDKIQVIENTFDHILQEKRFDKESISKLKQMIILKQKPIIEEERRLFDEMKDLSLTFKSGPISYVSPNFDGVQDEFKLKTTKFQKERVHGWKVVIYNPHLLPIKIIENLPLHETRSISLPETITWNMIDNDGTIVPDGTYIYELYTKDKHNNYFLREKGIIIVDTVPPHLIYSLHNTMFSPNGDSQKDNLVMDLDAEEGINWTCTITTPEGIIVKTYEWENGMPKTFKWDGTGDTGKVLREGVYNITFTGKDKAGNLTSRTIRGITLDLRQRQATVDIDHSIFSPNGDGKLDTVTFMPILSDRSRIDTWDFIIQTEQGETARRFRGRRYIPRRITWDGKAQKGKIQEIYPNGLPSEKYFYFLKVIYRSGVNTYSFKKELILDNEKPKIDLEVSPLLFSPDGDGNNDQLFIKPLISDLTPIIAWKATIFTSTGRVFKTFTGTTPPSEAIVWDGISDEGKLVDSGEDYYVQFEATDSAYNIGVSKKIPFSIDILVIPTERGLKIRVSNIQFGFNTATLEGKKTFEILDKIVSVFQKYKKYSIKIEGHTDSTGDESYNVILSKKRAESVGKYLIDHGIEQKRLSYEGYGSKYPIDTNETQEGRSRNRRVEFILVK